MTFSRSFLLLFFCVSLSACTGAPDGVLRACPQVAIVRALDRAQDAMGASTNPADLISVATLEGVEGSCARKKDGMDIRFNLSLKAAAGPRLVGNKALFPIFVSVVSAESAVLSKEVFPVSFIFKEGAFEASKTEALRVFLPLEPDAPATNLRVLIGFQLTPEQQRARGFN